MHKIITRQQQATDNSNIQVLEFVDGKLIFSNTSASFEQMLHVSKAAQDSGMNPAFELINNEDCSIFITTWE